VIAAENTSQTDVVVNGIKRMITSGELAPNARLPIEKELADVLGVSRTPLREGVRALSLLGVLETRQGAGTFVTALNPALLMSQLGFLVDVQRSDDAVHVHSVRRVLETEAAGSAALLVTDLQLSGINSTLDAFETALGSGAIDHEAVLELDLRFHRLIAEASGNPILVAFIEGLSGRTVEGRLARAINEDVAESSTLAEHRAIARALAEHSPDRARLRMANHLLSVEDYLRSKAQDLSD
jgi:DNA-binding FadR family transcriptional regulator